MMNRLLKICPQCITGSSVFSYMAYILYNEPDRIFCFTAPEAALIALITFAFTGGINYKTKTGE